VAPQGVWCPVESFSTDRDDAYWTAREIDFRQEETSFTVFCEGRKLGRFRTPLAGLFSVRNCLGAIAAAEALGISREATSEALATFKSVKRRMEVRGIVDEITIIDDFAHHPTAVRETLAAAAQRYPGRRIVAVYEPRTWTARKRIFQAHYGEAFAPAELVIIAGLFEAAQIATSEQLSIDELIRTLNDQGKRALTMKDADEIVARLVPELRPGDIVAVMSNGGFGGIHEKMLAALYGDAWKLTKTTAQSCLAKLGFYHGEIDGAIGPQSKQAIAAFQRAWRLKADETLTPQTLRVLWFVAACADLPPVTA